MFIHLLKNWVENLGALSTPMAHRGPWHRHTSPGRRHPLAEVSGKMEQKKWSSNEGLSTLGFYIGKSMIEMDVHAFLHLYPSLSLYMSIVFYSICTMSTSFVCTIGFILVAKGLQDEQCINVLWMSTRSTSSLSDLMAISLRNQNTHHIATSTMYDNVCFEVTQSKITSFL